MNRTWSIACAGCGAVLIVQHRGLKVHPTGVDLGWHVYPFRCPWSDELPHIDHVLRRSLDPASVRIDREHDVNPFLRYRRFLHSYHFARHHRIADAQFVDLVARLDDAIAATSGSGFAMTPPQRSAALEAQLGIEPPGAIWIKDETRGVAGSHKARHLMGIMLYLQVVEALGLDNPRGRPLAIASCGNAALAAAVVARAADYTLNVFVPATANPGVLAQIEQLGARVHICPRQEGMNGDPSYVRFQDVLRDGALPFCCQGPDNGLTIEGGETLWLEAAEALTGTRIDRVFVQAGGGALASACVQAFDDLHTIGATTASPRVHAVQTRGAFPLARAYEGVVKRLTVGNGDTPRLAIHAREGGECPRFQQIDRAMRYARTHRAQFMWPWETEPHSVAHGILDDETYDWAAVVEGMLRSDGSPVVVDDHELQMANSLARETTGIDVDHTGSAGLAGLMQMLRTDPAARREQMLVVFSGVRRAAH